MSSLIAFGKFSLLLGGTAEAGGDVGGGGCGRLSSDGRAGDALSQSITPTTCHRGGKAPGTVLRDQGEET